jgi:hypothetical protein
MSTGIAVTYRAWARCDCGWKGQRRSGSKREPHGSAAYADAAQHHEQTGHTAAQVEAGWIGVCRGCRSSSGRYQRQQEAWAWAAEHTATNPTHLRRQDKQQEHEEIAERIARAVESS